MTSDRWQQVKQLYYAALEHGAEERFQFLHKACAGDDALCREVESLLAFDHGTKDFIETKPGQMVARILANDQHPVTGSHAAKPIPSAIGVYRILRLLGEGGMGAVYEAEQHTPHRMVALKIIKLGLASHELLRRFEQEANATDGQGV